MTTPDKHGQSRVLRTIAVAVHGFLIGGMCAGVAGAEMPWRVLAIVAVVCISTLTYQFLLRIEGPK